MQIDIDINFLIENNITANQYLILYLLTSKKYSYLKKYSEITNVKPSEYKDLVVKGFIHYPNGDYDEIQYENILVREKFRELVIEKDFFDDFYDAYPQKVTRPSGNTDYLRTSSPKARELYSKITSNKKSAHEKILHCLKYEIRVRELENQMQYMKKMLSWLENEEWRTWEERMQEQPFLLDTPINNLGYGHELV